MPKDIKKAKAENQEMQKLSKNLAAALSKTTKSLKKAQSHANKTKKELSGEDDWD